VKWTSSEGRKINEHLDGVRMMIRDCYQVLQSKGRVILIKTIKDAFLRNGEPEYTLLRLVAYHHEQVKRVLEWSTLNH